MDPGREGTIAFLAGVSADGVSLLRDDVHQKISLVQLSQYTNELWVGVFLFVCFVLIAGRLCMYVSTQCVNKKVRRSKCHSPDLMVFAL